ncbi:hypothetical protein [Sandaracinus amylolyticus]|uniref:hypothetical protein n=1 Tax=Sandaracinus amylolyticus TaxID=927083 RepID=UPI001F17FA09|nr:hypothetical protein [Sandaracinus amylolyticus]UJR86253.1 Hypothetical protein I5071_83350 [Sandaracinus amylolyticus]
MRRERSIHRYGAAALVVSVLALGACATSGSGRGELQTVGKQREGDVEFAWIAEPDATRGDISATLPDGRVFRGTFLQITSSTLTSDVSPYWTTWGHAWYGGYGYPLMYYDYPGFVRTYSGRVIAQLEGPGEERMRCAFVLARPEDGPASGGMGDCEISTGEQIEYATLRGQDD